MEWDALSQPDQRWVCGACGRVTALGARRDELRDTSCVCNAVLCHAERDALGRWVAVDLPAKGD